MTGARIRFRARLQPEGTGTFVVVPSDVVERLGARGRTSVRGTVKDAPFRNQVMPYRDPDGEGRTWYMVVNKAVREAAGGLAAGDEVELELERDDAPRIVDVPAELIAALHADADARAAWDELPPSHRNQHAAWVAEAKRPDTRVRRAARTVERLPRDRDWR